MPFEKGRQKTGGKKKGTPNKKTLRFRELLEQHKVNFEEELAKAVLTGNVEMIRALKDLLPYLQPKIATTEEADPPQEDPQDLPQNEAELLTLIKPK